MSSVLDVPTLGAQERRPLYRYAPTKDLVVLVPSLLDDARSLEILRADLESKGDVTAPFSVAVEKGMRAAQASRTLRRQYEHANPHLVAVADGAVPALRFAGARQRGARSLLLVDPDVPELLREMAEQAGKDDPWKIEVSNLLEGLDGSARRLAQALREGTDEEVEQQRQVLWSLRSGGLRSEKEVKRETLGPFVDDALGVGESGDDLEATDGALACESLKWNLTPIVVVLTDPVTRYAELNVEALNRCLGKDIGDGPERPRQSAVRVLSDDVRSAVDLSVRVRPYLETRRGPDSLHPEISGARDHAPRFWLANDEPLYPTLPRPFAFDGLNQGNPGVQRLDLQDPLELAWFEGLPLAETMRQYSPLRDREIQHPPPVRVLYEGPELYSGVLLAKEVCREPARGAAEWYAGPCRDELDSKQVPEIVWSRLLYQVVPRKGVTVRPDSRSANRWLLDYEQSGRKHELVLSIDEFTGDAAVRLPGTTDEGAVGVLLTQYWFYYLYDRGPNPHYHDSEHVFVFSHDQNLKTKWESDVVAVVGAGHTRDVANNVLVASRGWSDSVILPADLDFCPTVLVELGKHASAPDRNRDGRFDPDMDANVHGRNAWGSRDAQMAAFGKVLLSGFQPSYSFPRSSRLLFQERWQLSGRQPHGRCPPDAIWQNGYELAPVSDIHELYRRLEERDDQRSRRLTLDWLQEHRFCFWGNAAPDEVEISKEAFDGMRTWPGKLDDKREVWTHEDFKNPEYVFKKHLFPRVALGIGSNVYGGDRLDRVFLRTADWGGLLHDDALTAFVGVETGGPQRGLREVGLRLELFRGRYTGRHGGLVWGSTADDEDHLSWTVGQTLAWPSMARLGRWARSFSLTLDVGLRGWLAGPRPRSVVGLEYGLSLNLGVIPGRHPLSY